MVALTAEKCSVRMPADAGAAEEGAAAGPSKRPPKEASSTRPLPPQVRQQALLRNPAFHQKACSFAATLIVLRHGDWLMCIRLFLVTHTPTLLTGGGSEDGGQPRIFRARPGRCCQPLYACAAPGALVVHPVCEQVPHRAYACLGGSLAWSASWRCHSIFRVSVYVVHAMTTQ